MMIYYALLNHSILAAAVIAAARFRALGPSLHPFIYLTWLALVNETLSLVLMYTIKTNSGNANIYTILEYLFLLFQFYYWLGGAKWFYIGLGIIGTILWALDNFVWHSITSNNSLFRAGYAIIIVLLALRKMNMLIVDDMRPVFKDGVFLICSALVFYNGCRAFMEIFNLFNVGLSTGFEIEIFWLLSIVNCISNLIYAIALLCIPMKQQFSWPL